MSGLGSSSNVRFTGLSAFGFCPTCGRGGQVWAVWPEAVHAVHRLAAKRTYAANSFLAFDPWFRVPSEWKRAISRGPWNRAMAAPSDSEALDRNHIQPAARQKKMQVRGRFLNFLPPQRAIRARKSSNRVRIDSCGCCGAARDSHNEHSGISPGPSPPGERRLRPGLPHGSQMCAYRSAK